MKIKIITVLLLTALLLVSCSPTPPTINGAAPPPSDLGTDDTAYGDKLEDIGAYDGIFDGDSSSLKVTYVSGTEGGFSVNDGVLTFSGISENSVYSLSGNHKGSIVVDIPEEYKLELELCGLSLISEKTNAITALSGDELKLTAKNGYENYIYDKREAIDESDESLYSGAIHSEIDLEIGGKGALTVISDNNNGIHTKDDLSVKNLTLLVCAKDNSLKGNDSVEIESGSLTLISTVGDGIKTTNSDISEKGNQRGNVSILGGEVSVYAACDGIDAAYNVIVEDESTLLNIYTDKYSNYSDTVTTVTEDIYYIRFSSKAYCYSVKYYNSDDDYEWVNAEYHSSLFAGRNTYYYYSFPKMAEYSKMQFFIYSGEDQLGQDEEYVAASDYLTPNTMYDTFALSSRGGSLGYSWTDYGRTDGPGGMGGGMSDGNTEKGDYSTKGIKAANEIFVSGGTVNIKSYDDAIHANSDVTPENGSIPKGNVTVSGGKLTLYTNDDGLHADGTLLISGGEISITGSYEGAEGLNVRLVGGVLSIYSRDDGINSTATSGTGVSIEGGYLYISCSGDGIDSNSRSSYKGISFSGGTAVILSSSGGNSAIDTEAGYEFTAGTVIALMPRGGMSNEATHCASFSSIATTAQLSLNEGDYLRVDTGSAVSVKMPYSLSATVIVLGSSNASISQANSCSGTPDANGVAFE
ncbi:MAG: carbohydrate-binding domain-containing protein [Clostridia bacterium]|nr:carbohydrate-binding domain-containing protein [Clostridia bacterium]